MTTCVKPLSDSVCYIIPWLCCRPPFLVLFVVLSVHHALTLTPPVGKIVSDIHWKVLGVKRLRDGAEA